MNPNPTDLEEAPQQAGGRTLLGHPPGLFLLFAVEMWERFSYYGMRGLLVLYLTAALAAHQVGKGTYTNTLRVTQGYAATDDEIQNKSEPPMIVTEVPLNVLVGDATGAAKLTPVPIKDGPLTFTRLEKRPDPNHQGKFVWEPVNGGDGMASPEFSVKQGQRPEGDEVRFRVTNAHDRKVKLNLKLLRPFPAADQEKMVADARAKPVDPKELAAKVADLKKETPAKTEAELSAAASAAIIADRVDA